MKIDELNSCIRDIFKKLLTNGFNKSSISEITLGRSFIPQCIKFIDDVDLGLKPLTRLIDRLGYQVHIVPVRPDDEEFQKYINKKTEEFHNESYSEILDYLDNKPFTAKPIKINKTFENIINQLLEEEEEEN